MTKTSAASLITPAQTSDMLSVSTATLRRYSTQSKKHMSKHAKAKRHQYTQCDLATLVKARDYIRGGNNAARTNILLGTMRPGDEPLLPTTAMNHAELMSAVEMARDELRVVGEQFTIMQETQTANSEQIAVLAAELKTLPSHSFVDGLLNRMPATTNRVAH